MAGPINKIKRSDLKLVKKIGEGGFSDVYQMTWKSQNGDIQVAAKRLLKRDVHELEVLSKLDHPNIVKLIGVVDEEIDFYLVLELCEGGSLRSYLDKQKDKRLSNKQFFDWAKQAARPLEYLKRKHIVHKDVKSPNYMITAEKNLKLGDFGLAKNIEATMSQATETASYHWMAPELLKKGILSPKYDIFAFAVVIWELRTRKFPFQGLESQVIAWKVCQENERLPIPYDCPQAIKDLMRQCWEADWKKRPDIEQVIAVIDAAEVQKARQMQLINDPWKLERTFGNHDGPGKLVSAHSIVANPNGDVAVADCLATQVKVYNSDGAYKFSLDTNKGLEPGDLSYPWQVTVNSEGNYCVTDWTEYVKLYDVNGVFKGKWVSSCPQASYTPQLWGLAIDAQGHMLVGDSKNIYINKHKQDGSYIASIKVDITPRYLTVTSQNTMIVAERNKPPQIVSNTGQVLYTLRHPVDESKWNPRGVHCYDDIIFIANANPNRILWFSESGEYLGHIPVVWGALPKGLTFVANEKGLLVCNPWSVNVYKIDTS